MRSDVHRRVSTRTQVDAFCKTVHPRISQFTNEFLSRREIGKVRALLDGAWLSDRMIE
jgi:hypothetical protein